MLPGVVQSIHVPTLSSVRPIGLGLGMCAWEACELRSIQSLLVNCDAPQFPNMLNTHGLALAEIDRRTQGRGGVSRGPRAG